MDLNQTYFTVSQFNSAFRDIIEETPVFKNIWVKGELSSLKFYQFGKQLYFNLTDQDSSLNCVMYDRAISQLKQQPVKGDHVFVRGSLAFFRKKGQLIFQVHALTIAGKGDAHESLAKLKGNLEKEGLFDDRLKKPLPKFPRRIGLVTSFQSAAMFDFFKLSRNIYAGAKLVVSPAVMQGDVSVPSIIEAINDLSDRCDVLVLCRGGGSAEDLSTFHSEQLVRHVFACPIPVVTGIGHESDVFLVDAVADKSCSTPSDAANTVFKHYRNCHQVIESVVRAQDSLRDRLTALANAHHQLFDRASVFTAHRFDYLSQTIRGVFERLDVANPLHKLRQGFSICELKKAGSEGPNMTVVRSVSDVKIGDTISVHLSDGQLKSTIEQVSHDSKISE